MSQYKQLYHDRSLGWPLGGCVTIHKLYRDKLTEGLNGWPIVSRYNDCIVTGAKARQAVNCIAIHVSVS